MIVSETCLKRATCKGLPFFLWVMFLGLGWGRRQWQRIRTHYFWLVYRGNACFASWSAVLWPGSCMLHIERKKKVPISFSIPCVGTWSTGVVWDLWHFSNTVLVCREVYLQLEKILLRNEDSPFVLNWSFKKKKKKPAQTGIFVLAVLPRWFLITAVSLYLPQKCAFRHFSKALLMWISYPKPQEVGFFF